MKKFLAILVSVLLVVGVFAACSGGDDTTTVPAGDSTTAEAADGSTTAEAEDGSTTAVAADGSTTAAATEEGLVKVIDIPLTDELYAFGVEKDNAELLASVNEFIAEIKEDGTLDEIVNKYYGDGTPIGVTSATEDSAKDQLVIATNAEFAPFEYMEGETFYGIDMELVSMLAEKLNKELVIKNVDFEAVCSNVSAGYADMAVAGLTINPERTEHVTFSDSYYTSNQMIIAPADDTAFDACTDAASVEAVLAAFDATTEIGVQTGTTAQYYVEGDEGWGFEGFDATCTGYSSGALAVQDLVNGNVNYVIIDCDPAVYIVNSINAAN